jgi:hypothetical protein
MPNRRGTATRLVVTLKSPCPPADRATRDAAHCLPVSRNKLGLSPYAVIMPGDMTTQLNPPEHRTGRPILDLTIGDARMRETSVRLSLLAILAVALFLRIVFAAGMAGDDDLSIAGRAIAILDHGLHVPLGHYSARLGLTLPLAGIFYVFGVGIAQLMALPMMASLLGIFLSYRIGRTLFDS